jgi:uncharacterized protein (DUF1330 family)
VTKEQGIVPFFHPSCPQIFSYGKNLKSRNLLVIVWLGDIGGKCIETLGMKQTIYITQIIYLKEGQEEIFNQFEDIAIPIISKYNGRLLLRLRPTVDSFIETNIEKPYEIHIVEFDSEQDFEDFKADKGRENFLHLNEQSIKATSIIQGIKI